MPRVSPPPARVKVGLVSTLSQAAVEIRILAVALRPITRVTMVLAAIVRVSIVTLRRRTADIAAGASANHAAEHGADRGSITPVAAGGYVAAEDAAEDTADNRAADLIVLSDFLARAALCES
jgi:hypothetical protein